ncbi:trehalose-phosphatase [Jannaschia ovalis]|uniref:Trehalose 6-phosphate phosphatase n=1 Tax=Jannaschia ovalis TaxID=3038773 RepID=A0ABY8LDS2_9RHOB|nr:trehalose-phosphatase [Jannaschia sp. GRR-S6-38]WGH79463.1 trehalose-phosphatase [Jannaschia sp. GRR-S6-38]
MQYYEMMGFAQGSDPCLEEDTSIDLPSPASAALFLDFDGTLVDIADRPDGITVTDAARDVLARAFDKLDGRVALVSGRAIDDLERWVPEFTGPLIGAHGSEFRLDGERVQAADYDMEMVSRLQRLVEDFGKLRPEFLVENKPTGVVLHYREAEHLAATAFHFMESLAQAADGFKLQPALMAYELKPECVGKDVALRRLIEREDFVGHVPIYAGDDLTDEPALQLVQDRGGIAIKVGPADTCAGHRLHDPAALLKQLGGWLA